MKRQTIIISAIVVLAFVAGISIARASPTLAQENIGEKCDKVFNGRIANGTTFDIRVNGTLIQTKNFNQLMFYDWCDLTWHDKKIVIQSLNMSGFSQGERIFN